MDIVQKIWGVFYALSEVLRPTFVIFAFDRTDHFYQSDFFCLPSRVIFTATYFVDVRLPIFLRRIQNRSMRNNIKKTVGNCNIKQASRMTVRNIFHLAKSLQVCIEHDYGVKTSFMQQVYRCLKITFYFRNRWNQSGFWISTADLTSPKIRFPEVSKKINDSYGYWSSYFCNTCIMITYNTETVSSHKKSWFNELAVWIDNKSVPL